MTTQHPLFNSAAPWLWALLTLVALIVSFFAAFLIGTTAVRFGSAGPQGLEFRLDLALFLVLMGAFGMLGALAMARLVFGRWLPVSVATLVIPMIGVALAVAIELALHEWARVHIGQYDWDYLGSTAGLSFLVVLSAVATFGVLVAPRGAVLPPLLGLGLAALMVGFVFIANVPGLGDGIEPESWPLAIGIGLSAAYVIGSVAVGVHRGLGR